MSSERGMLTANLHINRLFTIDSTTILLMRARQTVTVTEAQPAITEVLSNLTALADRLSRLSSPSSCAAMERKTVVAAVDRHFAVACIAMANMFRQ